MFECLKNIFCKEQVKVAIGDNFIIDLNRIILLDSSYEIGDVEIEEKEFNKIWETLEELGYEHETYFGCDSFCYNFTKQITYSTEHEIVLRLIKDYKDKEKYRDITVRYNNIKNDKRSILNFC